MKFKRIFFYAILVLQSRVFLALESDVAQAIFHYNNGDNSVFTHNILAYHCNNSNNLTIQIKAKFYLGLINYYGRCGMLPNMDLAYNCFFWIYDTFCNFDDETYLQIKRDSELIAITNRSFFYLAIISCDISDYTNALDYLSDVEEQLLMPYEYSIYINFFLDLCQRVHFDEQE